MKAAAQQKKRKSKTPVVAAIPSPPPIPPADPVAAITREIESNAHRYLLSGPAIHVGHHPLDEAWRRFETLWMKFGIGAPRDPSNPAFTAVTGTAPYNADAVALRPGQSADTVGVRIPAYAMTGKNTFIQWARANGFEHGMAITIDGLSSIPGHPDYRLPTTSDRQDVLRAERERTLRAELARAEAATAEGRSYAPRVTPHVVDVDNDPGLVSSATMRDYFHPGDDSDGEDDT